MIAANYKRIALAMLLGLSLAALSTEISYRILRRENREPARVELIIPAGTAEKIENGEQPPGIPGELTFVVGDTFVVVNQDEVDHQLGPLWIPPGTSASLNLDTDEGYSLDCSFQSTQVFGLDVRQPVTLSTRLTGIFFAGLPLGALFSVYSILLKPDKRKEGDE